MHLGHFQGTAVVLEHFAKMSARSDGTSKPCLFISFNSSITGIASRRAYDKPVYSDSVELKATSVCSWDFHTIGHPRNIIMYPCLDRAVSLSEGASSLFQFPAKSASTNTSNPLLGSGLYRIPLSRVPLRYRANQRKAFACSILGLSTNLAH